MSGAKGHTAAMKQSATSLINFIKMMRYIVYDPR